MSTNAKLFVANLSWSVTEQELYDLFGQAGSVLSAKIPTRREDGKPRGFAFIEMSSPEEAQRAIQQWHGKLLHDRDLVVTIQDESKGNGGSGARGQFSAAPAAPNAKLFVRNVDYSVNEHELSELFQQVGQVVSARIPTDRETGEPKGFAFVEMASTHEATQAIAQLNHTRLHQKDLAIDYQDPNRSKPKPKGNSGGYGRDQYQSRSYSNW